MVFKGFNSLNLFALQQPKVDLTKGNPAVGVEPQETICAFGDDASTGLDHISDDHAIPMVCMCVSCVGVQCDILQRSCIEAIDRPTVLYVLYSMVSAQQMKQLPENASQNNTIYAQRYILHI